VACRLATTAVISLLLTLASCGGEKEELRNPTDAPIADFSRRVDRYMLMRDSITDSIGDFDPTRSQAEIAARATRLATAIVNARADAKQGDLFTPDFATVMATLIKEEYSRRPDEVIETREDQQEELPDFEPKVNTLYPTTYPLATFPPRLLPLLPRLPDVLEYRIVRDHLILRDIEANVILDHMSGAVPPQG
jgi:hypothetical protein